MKSSGPFRIVFRLLLFVIFCFVAWCHLTVDGPNRSFHYAIRKGDLGKVIQMLDEKPQLLESRSPLGRTPFQSSAEKCQLEIMKELINRGADPQATCDTSMLIGNDVTALHLCLVMNEAEKSTKLQPIVEELLKLGVAINAKTTFGKTALDLAAEHRRHSLVEYLRIRGAKSGNEIP